MCFSKRWRAKREAKKQAKLEAQKATEEEKVVQKEQVEEKAAPEKKEAVQAAPAQEEKVTASKPAPKAAKYHVSQNKDDKSPNYKQWRVRKEGSKKTIKFFETQAEAITYAEDLAEKAGSSIVIHKVDGSIRKQDYSKK